MTVMDRAPVMASVAEYGLRFAGDVGPRTSRNGVLASPAVSAPELTDDLGSRSWFPTLTGQTYRQSHLSGRGIVPFAGTAEGSKQAWADLHRQRHLVGE